MKQPFLTPSFSRPGPAVAAKLLLLLIGIPFFSYSQTYWQQEVNHTIDVSLNDVEHTLDAFEKIEYTNHSPDTLRFIWFHVWPNAYKNDRTAFSEQLLLNNRTDFYFSAPSQRGYINRLNFQVNGTTARVEDHPQYIDVIKLLLPAPLPPAGQVTITTPFHVQLPENFSRGGHTKQSYQVTQWYPKPAVYDRTGWHEMPYLDQGEFYSEFGTYRVNITVPQNYVVAATGQLQNGEELEWLKKRSDFILPVRDVPKKVPPKKGHAPVPQKKAILQPEQIVSAATTKTLQYVQERVLDFAWFADKRYRVETDTVQLLSGNVVQAFSYYLPEDTAYWKNSITFIKKALLTRSRWLGEYPYQTVSAVEANMGFSGGMEYPTITSVSPIHSEDELELTLVHEVSHNWLQGVLATNERDQPWMDEGMNTYYDGRYLRSNYSGRVPAGKDSLLWISRSFRAEKTGFETFAGVRKDQPILTRSEDFTKENYSLVAYYKTGEWMQKIEERMGQPLFDSCMREYFRRWKFRHPYPEDFRAVLEQTSNMLLEPLFQELNRKGSLEPPVLHPKLLPISLFPLTQSNRYYYLSVGPSVGYNLYDGVMVGGFLHNYQVPMKALNFLAAPMYSTKSKKFSGIARASYSWYPGSAVYKITAGASGSLFSINDFQSGSQAKIHTRVRKLAPFVRVTLQEDPLSKKERWIQFKSFLINEDRLQFRQVITGSDTNDRVNTIAKGYFVNQLKFVINNYRALYPYSAELQVEQNTNFLRATFTGNYFFNYASRDGGLNLRFFAGKFSYTGRRTTTKQFETDRFHLNMSGPKGEEDYTYSNYFFGRSEFEGFASQQIMMRDGGFKVRTDLLSSKVGKTDNWLSALNFTADLPKKINPLQIIPVHIPIRVFADIGTSADAWDRESNTDRLLFDAGFQLSFLKNAVNIYIPVVYSKVYRDYFRSTLGTKRFWKILSFSIDIQNLTWRKLDPGIPL